jgi:hypothetical protein
MLDAYHPALGKSREKGLSMPSKAEIASRAFGIFYFEKFVQLKVSIYIYTGNLIRKENANACSSGTAWFA